MRTKNEAGRKNLPGGAMWLLRWYATVRLLLLSVAALVASTSAQTGGMGGWMYSPPDLSNRGQTFLQLVRVGNFAAHSNMAV
jgi:hypothetical protein